VKERIGENFIVLELMRHSKPVRLETVPTGERKCLFIFRIHHSLFENYNTWDHLVFGCQFSVLAEEQVLPLSKHPIPIIYEIRQCSFQAYVAHFSVALHMFLRYTVNPLTKGVSDDTKDPTG